MQSGTVKLLDSVPPSGTWLPDGKALLYIDTRDGVANIMRQPVAGGPPTALTHFTADQIFGYAVSSEQKRLAIVRGRVTSDASSCLTLAASALSAEIGGMNRPRRC